MGGISDQERDQTIAEFRDGKFSILICTNVIARGIDVPEVDLVINYDIPLQKLGPYFYEPDYENYLHRVGRTGRFGTDGLAITFHKGETKECDEGFFMN